MEKQEEELVSQSLDVSNLLNSFDEIFNEFLANNSQLDQKLYNRLKRITTNLAYIQLLSGRGYSELNFDANPCRIIIETLDLLFPLYVAVFSPANEYKIQPQFATNIKYAVEMITNMLNSATFNYMRPCHFITEANGLKVIFQYLTSDILVKAYVKLAKNQDADFYGIDCSLRQLACIVILCARLHDKYLNKWKELNAIRCLLDYLRQTKDIQDNRLICCMAIAFIATDADVDELPELKEIVPVLCDLIGQVAQMMESDPYLMRGLVNVDETPVKSIESTSIFIDEENEAQSDMKEVAMIFVSPTNWSLLNLVKSLYHLSVSDKMKNDIYYKNHMDKYLKLIIFHGNTIEKEYALKLLMQLCFSSDIKDKVAGDKELVDKIKAISSSSTSRDEEQVKAISKSILWMVEKQSSTDTVKSDSIKLPQIVNTANGVKETNEVAETEHPIKANHIMISYNRESRELCLKVKKELEEMGHKVWIDVESISGSSMESMAKAVEDSACVLMCMTEKYKQSNNCRAEAEYAFQRNKPIIPLIMQKDYQPDGWLGFILGSKIFVHFMKYDFDECMKRLSTELKAVFSGELVRRNTLNTAMQKIVLPSKSDSASSHGNDRAMSASSTHRASPDNIDQAKLDRIERHRRWTNKQVKEWLDKKSFHPAIANMCKSCDGRLLHEMSLIKKESPDFFFKTLTRADDKLLKLNINLKDVAAFNLELKALFS